MKYILSSALSSETDSNTEEKGAVFFKCIPRFVHKGTVSMFNTDFLFQIVDVLKIMKQKHHKVIVALPMKTKKSLFLPFKFLPKKRAMKKNPILKLLEVIVTKLFRTRMNSTIVRNKTIVSVKLLRVKKVMASIYHLQR